MKAFITITSIGFVATDEKFNVIEYNFFNDKLTKFLEDVDEKIVLPEEAALIENLSSNYDVVTVETQKNMSCYDCLNASCRIDVEKHTPHGDYVRENFDEIISRYADININETLNSTYMDIASEKIRASVKSNDVMIVESVNSLEELEDSTGKLIERLREWCTPYLPELEKLHNHELYAKIISSFTSREELVSSGVLENTNVVLDENYAVDVSDDDLDVIKSFASSVYKLYESKNLLEEYLDSKIREVAPNLYSVAGGNLSAKLIAHVNGLENLAKLPSSTVQVIGAEKAIFRHLKTGENPPKHGLIFQHPLIRGSNWWVRGKLARSVAGKISIAARKDAFGGDFDPHLKVELEEHVEEIKKAHPFPERKNRNRKNSENKNGRKNRKEKGKKKKRNKRKLRKGEYSY